MGHVHPPQPVLRVAAAFSRYDQALDWFAAISAAYWGPVARVSPHFAFGETDYYRDSMGDDLKKTFLAYQTLVDPGDLPLWKHQTNTWEQEYAALVAHPQSRPLNVDPGYITPGKLVLASTKDHAHRLYLSQGIYAEVTLTYRRKKWQSHPWTYPDYQRPDFQAFFEECRLYLRSLRAAP